MPPPDDPWISLEALVALRDAAIAGDERAVRQLEALSDKGSGSAMSVLGVLLALGSGLSEDVGRGRVLLAEAAALGHGDAAHNLGMLYGIGAPGIAPNSHKFRAFVLRARDLGCACAIPEYYEDLARAQAESLRAAGEPER